MVKNARRAVVRGMRRRMDFITSLPSLVGIIFSIIQHVIYMKNVAINYQDIDCDIFHVYHMLDNAEDNANQ